MNTEITKSIIRVLPFLVALIIILIFIKKGRIDVMKINLQLPTKIPLMVGIWVAYLLFILGIEYFSFRMGWLTANKWNYGGVSTFIRLVGAIVLAPVVEEILFRGLILNALLQRRIRFVYAVIIQAIVFVLMHNIQYQNDFQTYYTIAYGLMDSSLFAIARKKTESLFTSIGMHMIGNAIAIGERFIL